MTSTVSSGPYVANNSEVGNSDMSSNKRAKQSSSSTDASSGGSAPKKPTVSASAKPKTSSAFKAAPVRVHALESGVERPPSLLEDARANEAMTELVLFPQWRYVVEPTCADSSEEPRSPTPPPQDVADEHQATTRPVPHPDNATNTDQPQPRHPATEPGSSLFVAGLPSTVDDAALEILLSKFGRLICAKVALSPNTALSRGFAFVHYVTLAEADAARKALHGAAFPGHGGRLQIETSHRSPADHFQSATGSRVVMLRQVPTSCTVAEIQALASKHGEVVSCEMRSVPKGVEETSATLRFRRSNDAAACVQTLHGKMPFHQCHLPFVARLVTAPNSNTPTAAKPPLHGGQRHHGAAATTATTTKSSRTNIRSPKPQLNHQDPSSVECHASTTAPNEHRSSPSPGPALASQHQQPQSQPQPQPPRQTHQQQQQQMQPPSSSAAPLPPPFMWPGSYFPAMTGTTGGYASMPQQPMMPAPGFAQHWGAGAPPLPPVWAAPQQAPGWPPSWAGTAPPPPLPPAMMGPSSGGWYPPTG
jgi:RNA recognition motif-containing protein